MSETEKNERIAEPEATSAKLLAEVRKLEKVGTELEHIAAARLDELVDLRARVLELEPLAEVGRRMQALPVGLEAWHVSPSEWCIYSSGGTEQASEPTLLDALRAAGIGEEVGQ